MTDLSDAFVMHAAVCRSQYDDTCRMLAAEVIMLRQAIRTHRDVRGDDRCWRDDESLYQVLPEGFTPPVYDTAVELARCEQYIRNRHHPGTVYVSPEREIERLRAALEATGPSEWFDPVETRIDNTTGKEITPEEWCRFEWYDVTTRHGYTRGVHKYVKVRAINSR